MNAAGVTGRIGELVYLALQFVVRQKISIALIVLCQRLLILTAATVSTALADQAQAFASDEKVIFRFGSSSVTLERSLVPHQPYPSRHSARDWARVSEYKMAPGQSVFFRLPAIDAIPASSRCRQLGLLALNYITLPARGAPNDKRPLSGMHAVRSGHPNISKLVSSAGRETGYYEFDADDLRDFWGDKQSFFNGPATVLLLIQISRHIQISASPPADGCFFRDGAELTRQIRSFVLQRLANNL